MEKILPYLYSINRKETNQLEYKIMFNEKWVVESFNGVNFSNIRSVEGITLYSFTYESPDLSDIIQHNKVTDYITKIIDLNERIDNKNKEVQAKIDEYKSETERLKNELLEDFKKTNVKNVEDGSESKGGKDKENSGD